jgi:leucine dehydrogenase
MSSFEEIAVMRGHRSGATMAVAVHSTTLGPALGGVRMWHYTHDEEAIADAMRLAESMTHKAAAAGLDLGGGKGVISVPGRQRPQGELRRALLLDFADLVESLEGRYVTAEDVGTGAGDMAVIAERTAHVVGLGPERGGSGDPSPLTALGVRAAMRACAAARFGTGDLAGLRVTVIGFGHVGAELAGLLQADGAELVVAEIDPSKRELARALGIRRAEPAGAATLPCDVLAPCALGGLVDSDSVERLRCEVLCGAANNVLADKGLAERLKERSILYAPDFIANAGGLISVYGELHGYDRAKAVDLVAEIEPTMAAIIAEADAAGIPPLEAARRRSEQRLLDQAALAAGGA